MHALRTIILLGSAAMTLIGACDLVAGEWNRRLRRRDLAARVDGASESLKNAQTTAARGWRFVTLGPIMFLLVYYTF
jgi:hypothetical protein